MSEKDDSGFAQNLLNNLFELWLEPEIKVRQSRGTLPTPARIFAGQIIFKIDDKPLVRLNSEIRGVATVKLAEPISDPIQEGDAIRWSQVAGIEKFDLIEEERDYGHATIVNIRNVWSIRFNFVYNKSQSRAHLAAAREFLLAAKLSLKSGLLRPAVDNLHSASELAAKAYLLSAPDRRIMETKRHGLISSKINAARKLGNVQPEHVDSYNSLGQLRPAARYLNGDLVLTDQTAGQLVEHVEDFIAQVEKRYPEE